MRQNYTAAIVGCGDIAHHHVKGYQRAGVELVAAIDPLEVARAQYREEYGIERDFASVEEMLAADEDVCACWLVHDRTLSIGEVAATGGLRRRRLGGRETRPDLGHDQHQCPGLGADCAVAGDKHQCVPGIGAGGKEGQGGHLYVSNGFIIIIYLL